MVTHLHSYMHGEGGREGKVESHTQLATHRSVALRAIW